MKKHILLAATAVALSLPLASYAAEQTKNKINPFMSADKDGDGRISSAEYMAAMMGKQDEAASRAKFAALDQNKDGSLSREEYEAGAAAKKTGKKKKADS
jgi:hypothetical protein